jgi:hypothetical protein
VDENTRLQLQVSDGQDGANLRRHKLKFDQPSWRSKLMQISDHQSYGKDQMLIEQHSSIKKS